MPETTRLAQTIQTWWPAILVALTEDVTNARTEGFNRIIKQTKTSRLRLPQHGQLPAPYPQPHRGHPTAEISSMNGTHPAQVRRAGNGVEHSEHMLFAMEDLLGERLGGHPQPDGFVYTVRGL